MLVISATMVSCGKNNKSGGGSSSSGGGIGVGGFGSYGNINVAGYSGNLGQLLNVVASENPCRTTGGGYGYGYGQQPYQNSNARTVVAIPLQGINVNAGSLYVGVTPEGDIAVVSNTNGGPRMELHLCARPDLTGQGQLMANPVLNSSQRCPIGEITASDVMLQSSAGAQPYILKYAPIHIPGTDRYSSICQ